MNKQQLNKKMSYQQNSNKINKESNKTANKKVNRKINRKINKKVNIKKVNRKRKLIKKRQIRILTRCAILLLIIIGLFLAGYSIVTAVIKHVNASKIEENKEVKQNVMLDNATQVTVNGLLTSIINRSYNTIGGEEELKFYSTEGKKALQENGAKERTIAYYKSNELEQKIISSKIERAYYEGDKLVVEATAIVETTHGNKDYIRYVEPIGTKNEMNFRIVMVKENNEYKVQYYYTLDSKVMEDKKK
jgi:hypothetical protein